ncbi:MAG: LPS export ABC transporter permease LptF [bacterium]
MKVFNRYIFKEVVQAWIASAIVLQFVVSSNYLGQALSDVAKGRLPADLVFNQLGLQSLEIQNLLMPLSLFAGIMLTLGRLQRDSEWVVMRSAGFGEFSMLRGLLYPGIIGVFLSAIFALWISPWADRVSDTMIEQAASQAGFAGLTAGRFESIAGGAATVYVQTIDPDSGKLNQIFVFSDHEGVQSITTALSGEQRLAGDAEKPYLNLHDGQRIEGKPGTSEYQMLTFKDALIRLPVPELEDGDADLESIPTKQLLGSNNIRERVELQWRLSMPIAAFLLVLAAVPLARSAPRSGRGGRLFLGLLAYLVYSNLIVIARGAARKEQIDVLLAMNIVHALAFIIIIYSLRKSIGKIGSLLTEGKTDAHS